MQFTAESVIFSHNGETGIPFTPNDNIVVFKDEHSKISEKNLGKSMWKVVDNNSKKVFAVIFPGISDLKSDEFELSIKGKVYASCRIIDSNYDNYWKGL
jgi:hypothetical protein